MSHRRLADAIAGCQATVLRLRSGRAVGKHGRESWTGWLDSSGDSRLVRAGTGGARLGGQERSSRGQERSSRGQERSSRGQERSSRGQERSSRGQRARAGGRTVRDGGRGLERGAGPFGTGAEGSSWGQDRSGRGQRVRAGGRTVRDGGRGLELGAGPVELGAEGSSPTLSSLAGCRLRSGSGRISVALVAQASPPVKGRGTSWRSRVGHASTGEDARATGEEPASTAREERRCPGGGFGVQSRALVPRLRSG